MKRLLCCLLALVLLAMASTRAESSDDPALEDLRQWLYAEHVQWIEIPEKNGMTTFLLIYETSLFDTIRVQVNLDPKTKLVMASGNNLINYAPEDALEVSRICNRLNQRWKCLGFLNDTATHKVSIKMITPFVRAEDAGETVGNLVSPFVDAVIDAWALLASYDCTGQFTE